MESFILVSQSAQLSRYAALLENVVPKTIYSLRHGDSFYPSFPSLFFYIPLAMCESHRR